MSLIKKKTSSMFVKRSLPAATSSAAEATKRPKVQSVLRAAIDDANTSAQEELERRRVELDEANEQRELLAPTPPGVRGGAERHLSGARGGAERHLAFVSLAL